MSGMTNVPPPTTTLTPLSSRGDRDADPAGLADEVVQAERLRAFRPAKHAEHSEDETEPQRPGDAAQERSGACVKLEDLRSDEAADAEHRNEPEQRWHERDAADMYADVQRVEHPTDDVVEDDGKQQQAAADGEAEDEDPVGDVDLQHASPPARRF